ncbi:hypothetical protein [Paenibacillus whitsoniae]|uniref:Uncharacterized protein n=1 Tax=Paenibacillus whitsoniae TaxID=2496558 RepID=A0A430JKW3_9BACL|nr:hypothetical protein [Paenibacillus whitsoniae]RTE11697.1 hypothetical protein EJQ19_00690 [Paenibacillus whitsoniae]
MAGISGENSDLEPIRPKKLRFRRHFAENGNLAGNSCIFAGIVLLTSMMGTRATSVGLKPEHMA